VVRNICNRSARNFNLMLFKITSRRTRISAVLLPFPSALHLCRLIAVRNGCMQSTKCVQSNNTMSSENQRMIFRYPPTDQPQTTREYPSHDFSMLTESTHTSNKARACSCLIDNEVIVGERHGGCYVKPEKRRSVEVSPRCTRTQDCRQY
jgi:hypothetical protein